MTATPQIHIGPLAVGGDAPVACIAEIGNAHDGDFVQALELLDAAKAAGADAAKLQCYTPDELVALRGDGPAPDPWGAQGWTMRALYQRAMTPRDWFPALFDHARAIGLPLFSSVFGLDSFRLLESVDNPCYKLAALDEESGLLAALVGRTGKPIIRSSNSPVAPPRLPGVLTLYAPPGYPQPTPFLSYIQHGYDGYSYHGTNPEVPANAVAAGARVVEVHLQLGRKPSELEAAVSLTEWQFREMVDSIRGIEAARAQFEASAG